MKIEGAVALVTGGAMGIGKEVVETLLQKGVKVRALNSIWEVIIMSISNQK